MTSIFIFISGHDAARLQRRAADRLARRRVARAADLGLPARDPLHRHRVRRHRPGRGAEPRGRAGRRARPRARDRGLVHRRRARARRDPHTDAVQHPARLHRHLRGRSAADARVRAARGSHDRRRRRADPPVRRVDRVRRLQGDAARDGDVPQPRDHRGAERGRRGRRPRLGASAGHLDDEPVHARRAGSRAGSTSAWPCWRSAGSSSAPPPSAKAPNRSSSATTSKARCSAPPSSPRC